MIIRGWHLALGIVAVAIVTSMVVSQIRLSQRQQIWQARTDSLLGIEREKWVTDTERLEAERDRERQRGDSLLRVTVRLVAQYHQDAAATRIVLGRVPTGLALDTLPAEACRKMLGELAGSCAVALARADTVLNASDASRRSAERRATLSDSLGAVHRQRALTLEDQLRSAPIGDPKWFWFLPRPRFVVGVGCAGGWKFGCGLSGTIGFVF